MAFQTWKTKLNSYLEYNFPLYYWIKSDGLFKFPKIKIYFFNRDYYVFGMRLNRSAINPIISIESSSVGWKSKWGDVSLEWAPFFHITLFKRYSIHIEFNYYSQDGESIGWFVWENMVRYNVFKEIKYINCNWKHFDKEQTKDCSATNSLTKKGLIEWIKYCYQTDMETEII